MAAPATAARPAAGYSERLGTVLGCLKGGVPRVLTGLHHAHPDPALASGLGALRESALRSLGRVPVPEFVLCCGGADVALWLYARGYDHYAVKTELRAYGFGDARYFADVMRDGPEGARQHATAKAGRAGDAIAPDVPYADDPAAWHAVWSEVARSIVGGAEGCSGEGYEPRRTA